MIFELSPWIIAWCALAMACGGLIKGLLGIGTPLLTVPMMALVLPAHHAVVIMAFPVVVANLWQVYDADQPVATIKRFWPAFAALLIGTWIGLKVLTGIDEKTLLFLVGILVICLYTRTGFTTKDYHSFHYGEACWCSILWYCGSDWWSVVNVRSDADPLSGLTSHS